MKLPRLTLLAASVLLASCAATVDRGTIADLRQEKPDLADENIEGGIEKAMAGYQKFLQETPESAMTPEALRRLADLKIEKEYGLREGASRRAPGAAATVPVAAPAAVAASTVALGAPALAAVVAAPVTAALAPAGKRESEKDFERRAATAEAIAAKEPADDLNNAGAVEALALYQQLLDKYPNYERNDQVLYQMSRAHEELGNVDEAMNVMNRIVKEYPESRYVDEIQFRRGEYYFTRRKFLEAEKAYLGIVKSGERSFYYELALYKLGWTFYKQDMHEDAMHQFIGLLDYKVRTGYDFEHPKDEAEQKRIEDTHRIISLSFSSMGGPEAVVAYFDKYGKRAYEVDIYRNLGEHYLEKRRYADAALSYQTFVKSNPFHKVAPHFDMRVIEIYKQGGFPQLVIDANKAFSTNYGLKSAYWTHFNVESYPEVLALLKSTLKELANYYHALYQDKQFDKAKADNFREAGHWYHEFLDSFPKDAETPVMNYQFADLLLENKSFGEAAREYERTAYDYPAHAKSAGAGYAAVYAYREHLALATDPQKAGVKQEVIRSSLRFADAFPQHEKAALVMGAALEDIYAGKDYAFAVTTGRKMLTQFPAAEPKLRSSAWLVVAHSSYELAQYKDAEEGYVSVLALTGQDDSTRQGLVENLAASIYKQGEQANAAADYLAAADHFLRVATVAPTSKIRATADFDGATALVHLKSWERAAEVLLMFRKNYPGHQLQPDVTKKVAYVYQQAEKLALAAAEYERIETENKDEQIRREALELAAELYMKAKSPEQALKVHRRYIAYFPQPVGQSIEVRNKVAEILKAEGGKADYLKELKAIVDADLGAGKERNDRTRYLGGTAALILTEPKFTEYADLKLTQPFDKSLKKKSAALKATSEVFSKLTSYQVGDVTAAATYYIAEIYFNFSESMKTSERPKGMDELEAEEYEEALDEKAYPFEEKAIQIHEKNTDLMTQGVYNNWIDKSFERLATLMPGRYAKPEASSGLMASIDAADFTALVTPKPVVVPPPVPATPAVSAGTSAPAPSDGVSADPAPGTDNASPSASEVAAPEQPPAAETTTSASAGT
ncbi:MAG: tetratricopeptide repeat protein [Pseudomonadota bacterium]